VEKFHMPTWPGTIYRRRLRFGQVFLRLVVAGGENRSGGGCGSSPRCPRPPRRRGGRGGGRRRSRARTHMNMYMTFLCVGRGGHMQIRLRVRSSPAAGNPSSGNSPQKHLGEGGEILHPAGGQRAYYAAAGGRELPPRVISATTRSEANGSFIVTPSVGATRGTRLKRGRSSDRRRCPRGTSCLSSAREIRPQRLECRGGASSRVRTGRKGVRPSLSVISPTARGERVSEDGHSSKRRVHMDFPMHSPSALLCVCVCGRRRETLNMHIWLRELFPANDSSSFSMHAHCRRRGETQRSRQWNLALGVNFLSLSLRL